MTEDTEEIEQPEDPWRQNPDGPAPCRWCGRISLALDADGQPAHTSCTRRQRLHRQVEEGVRDELRRRQMDRAFVERQRAEQQRARRAHKQVRRRQPRGSERADR